jgi:uncharacterized Zn-binding protein involved in type VI secretion
MSPAARRTDPTGHGDPLGPGGGSSNVIIGGLPAWRATVDKHTCPKTSGSTPHVGGVVAVGSRSVRINGLPAAREGDVIPERAGPPNPVAKGCPTVLIGG